MFLRDGHVREQRVVLEHHAEAALFRRQRIDAHLVEPDAAARELHEPGDAVERGRLAAAGRPEQADEFAALDRQRKLVERVERLAARAGEAARHAVELEFAEIVFHESCRSSCIPSFPRKRESIFCSCHSDLDPRFRGMTHPFPIAPRPARGALGRMRHLVFCAPTSLSQRRYASTTAFASSVGTCGYCASHVSYSGRPNSLIASWLSFGAIDSGTFLTDGPG